MVLGAVLGSVGEVFWKTLASKMVFLEASLAMLRDLGAKMANKSANMIFTVCFSYIHCNSVNFIMCF